MNRNPSSLWVLLVEDSRDDVDLVVRALRRGGYDVTWRRVDSESSMIQAIEEADWDIVLSDHGMPRFDAPSALAVLHQIGLDIPFIVVSGVIGDEIAAAIMKQGAHDIVPKDNLARLRPAVDRELREARERRDQRALRTDSRVSDRLAAIGALAAGVAHEIDNPLGTVALAIDAALAELASSARQLGIGGALDDPLENLAVARGAAADARRIVRDLKLLSGFGGEQSASVDVEAILDIAIRMARAELRHCTRTVRSYSCVPLVHDHQGGMARVLLSVVVDAASAMRECNAHSNEILLSTAIDDSGRVVVTIADTGPGIAPEMLSRLFDPSFSTKVTAEGPVLGWSSCRRIVADLGGTIDVVSELGKGSIVRLVLLPAAQPSPSASRDVEPSVTSRRRRILVVNDDPGCGFALERARGRSHEIVVETSGASAIERLREGEQFDLILSDVMMPQMTGIDLHAALLRSNPDEVRRMVFISGGAFAPDVRALLENMTNPALDESLDQRQLREFASEWMAATLDRPRNVAR